MECVWCISAGETEEIYVRAFYITYKEKGKRGRRIRPLISQCHRWHSVIDIPGDDYDAESISRKHRGKSRKTLRPMTSRLMDLKKKMACALRKPPAVCPCPGEIFRHATGIPITVESQRHPPFELKVRFSTERRGILRNLVRRKIVRNRDS